MKQSFRVTFAAAIAESDGWLFAAGGAMSLVHKLSVISCLNMRNGEVMDLPSGPNSGKFSSLAVFHDTLVLFGGHPLREIWRYDEVLMLDLSK